MRRRYLVVLIALALVFSLAALPTLVRATHLPAGTPAVQILAPLDGQEVSSLGVRLQVSVTDFTLDPAAVGGAIEAGHGHFHVFVNGALKAGGVVAEPIVDVSDFPIGPMTLGVQLVNNDHSSLSPQVWHNISVTVADPSISIVGPTDGASVSTLGLRLAVAIGGLQVDTENYGGTPIPGHGHYHLFVDGAPAGAPTDTTITVGPLTPGAHTIKVNLRNNDHSLIMPEISDTVTVTAVDPAVAPTIAILAPAADATVSTLGFRLKVAIQGLEIDAENFGGPNVLGHGHYHVFVDGATVGQAVETVFDVGPLSAGTRTIKVDLRNNDHTSLLPAVEAQITVTAVAPSISIVAPATDATVSTLGFQLQVEVQGLEIDVENYGGPNVPGHGHYHLFVDGAPAGAPTDTTITVGPLMAGARTIKVDMRNNDHTLIMPEMNATISVMAVEPSIQVLDPAANAMVSSLGFRLRVAIAGLEVDLENYGGSNIPGHGHYHLFVDGAPAGAPTDTTITVGPLTPGAHTIKVNLRNNDHSLITPERNDTVTVTVVAPSISIVAPAAGAVVGSTVSLEVDIQGFVIDAEAVGLVAEAGRGHYHVTVDGTTMDAMVTGLVYALEGLSDGPHAIQVSLHNNDHSALSPAVMDEVMVTVSTAVPGIEPVVFVGTTVGLLVLLAVVAVALVLWARRGRGGGQPPT